MQRGCTVEDLLPEGRRLTKGAGPEEGGWDGQVDWEYGGGTGVQSYNSALSPSSNPANINPATINECLFPMPSTLLQLARWHQLPSSGMSAAKDSAPESGSALELQAIDACSAAANWGRPNIPRPSEDEVYGRASTPERG